MNPGRVSLSLHTEIGDCSHSTLRKCICRVSALEEVKNHHYLIATYANTCYFPSTLSQFLASQKKISLSAPSIVSEIEESKQGTVLHHLTERLMNRVLIVSIGNVRLDYCTDLIFQHLVTR